MLLTITAEPRPDAGWPATDLGFLLHKNPERVQAFDLAYGKAHVFYPEAVAERCTAALLLEVDPIGLVRGKSGKSAQSRNTPDFALGNYVNDRPYAASSLLASALGQVFRTALRGRCDQRPELAGAAIPLRIEVPALPCGGGGGVGGGGSVGSGGGPELAALLFEPLGWTVDATPIPLDPAFPEWGDSRYVHLVLTGTVRLADALSHLYVLLPVLDGSKHYWISTDEVDKLVRAGEGWLAEHPARRTITRRYLARRQSLVREALARLAEVDDTEPSEIDNAVTAEGSAAEGSAAEGAAEESVEAQVARERKKSLTTARHEAVIAALHEAGAARVLDLGCGEGALIRELLKDSAFTEVVGVDVSARALSIAERRLKLDRMPERVAARLTLRQGSLTYTDQRLAGYDAAVLMEVVEHVDLNRLGALEHTVFGAASPGAVVVTTPNVEYNVRYEGMAPGARRHADHRFEWTRAEFEDWAARVAAAYGYRVDFKPVGEVDVEVGSPTQLALFVKVSVPAAQEQEEVAADV